MTKQEINAKYNAMYAQLVEWQSNGEVVCTKWMAEFGRIADMDYTANKELYA